MEVLDTERAEMDPEELPGAAEVPNLKKTDTRLEKQKMFTE